MILLGIFICAFVAMILQTIIHEGGHLIFGLLSGYHFGSFRVFNLIWIKEDGAIRLRRLSITGTAGQCLMVPPEPVDGKFPVVLCSTGRFPLCVCYCSGSLKRIPCCPGGFWSLP